MKHTVASLLLLAVYITHVTAQETILPMGYEEAWTSRLLFNDEGGYNFDYTNNPSVIHGWEQLYEAQEGDVYTISMPTACSTLEGGRLEFRTPINIYVTHRYSIQVGLTANKDVSAVTLALCGSGDGGDATIFSTQFKLTANRKYIINKSNIEGSDIHDLKFAFAFATQEDDTDIKISSIRLYDITDNKELWAGTSYYNWCYYAVSKEDVMTRIADMGISGRKETLSWTQADFDDSQWSEAEMPIGNIGALPVIRTEWPGGENTNYWIRRNFMLGEVHATSRYMLHAIHDDSYRIYVNGTLLREDTGWTSGTNAEEVEIPDSLLRTGNNVIATYIQQNWGGKCFDCALTEERDFYENFDDNADPSKLLINEIEVGNIDQFIDHSFNYGAWMELYNPTDKDMSLEGLYVTDDPAEPQKFKLPVGIGVIKNHDFKVIYFDHNSADGVFGTTAYKQVRFKLKNAGGAIFLYNEDRRQLTSATYPEQIPRCSWARTQDGGNEWSWTGTPTPAASNVGSNFAVFRLNAPVVDTDSRIFTDPFSITINIPEGATLRYTTDGSAPSADNGMTSSDGRFNIDATTILRMRLEQEGLLPGPVITRSYIFRDKEYYLPVISIATNKDNLYNSKIGVYVDGTNGVEGRNHGKSNINMDWERPVNFEYITADGRMGVNQEAEFVISGGWSRHYAPASFKIKATKRYEGLNSIDFPFFTDKPHNKYRQILIRNGGNDNDSPGHGRVRDAITQKTLLSSGFYADCQDYQPVHVFFNGKYIGQLNLREPNNRYHGYANYGYDDDEMDAFEYSNGYFQMAGTKNAFNKWKELASRSSDRQVYEEMKQLIDIDEVVNYWAAISYIGCSDWICNNNNVKGYRSLPDGKFHLTVLDQDWGWSNANGVQLIEGNYGNELLGIYNGMKRGSADFRRRFIDAYCILQGSVFTKDRCLSIGDSICRMVEPALAMENKAPWASYNEQKSAMSGTTSRTQRMNSLRSAYGLGAGMNVSFSANASGAAFLLNGQPVPTATFNGMLFAPVTLDVSAPAGYNFIGWSQEGNVISKIFSKGDKWSYWDKGSLDGTDWKTGAISWAEGITPLGYGKNDIATTISYGSDSNKKHITYYFRKNIQLEEAPSAKDIFTLNFTADDGFVVYVNGTEVYRYLMPEGEVSYSTYATTYASDNPDSGTFTLPANLFHKGSNIIAVEVHNNVPGSSDIYWDAELAHLGNTGTTIISRERTLTLDKDADTHLQAIFTKLKNECLVEAGAAPVVINEVSAGNTVAANEYGKRNDWIELYNTTDHDIDLEGMFLTDDPMVPEKYCITALAEGSTIIPAHGHYIIWADKLNPLRQLHTGFKLANNDEESVTISAADGSWSDCLTYRTHTGEESVGRYPDGGKRVFRMTRPTPEATNTLTSYSQWLSGIDENFDEDAFLDAIMQPEMAHEGRGVEGSEYYSIEGLKLNVPKSGINIVRFTDANGKVSSKRILVK